MTDTTPPDGGRITDLLLEREMRESYLNYSMSVILSRALPDARDGLKPSQRRVLVAMNDLNLGPRGKHRKCAKICGDTSGNYHPHGESVVYPTLVGMAQPFTTRYPMVDSQGNFGAIEKVSLNFLPEPGRLALLGAGMFGLLALFRARRR